MSLSSWLFGESTSKELSDDEKEVVARLVERMNRLEKDSEVRELEWSSWYDKFRQLYARIAKRAERAEAADKEAPEAPESTIPGRPANDGPPIPFRSRRAF